MDREVFTVDRRKCPSQEAPNSRFLAMDATYIKVKGKWAYDYRAIERFGKTLDFMLSEHRDEAAATAFFTRAIGNNGFPDRVVIDKSGANLAGLQNMNCLLILNG
jgi:putative transposase